MEMTLAEAQALQCNQCGDCCDSRRARRFSNTLWSWGHEAAGPMIIPLRMTHEGTGRMDEYEDDVPRSTPVAYTAAFRCALLVPLPDGVAQCGAHGDPTLPPTCSAYPVFEGHATWIAEEVAKSGSFALHPPERCTWHGVVIVPDVAAGPCAIPNTEPGC